MHNRLDRSAPVDDEGERQTDAQAAAREQTEAEDETAARARELEDPDVQYKINNPEELDYTLVLERPVQVRRKRRVGKGAQRREIEETVVEQQTYERRIKIRIAFTPNDVQKRNVLDLIDSHYRMIAAECADLLGVRTVSVLQLLDQRPGYVEAAMTLPACRNLARRIVSAMAYAEDDQPVTFQDVALGMQEKDLQAFQLVTIYRLFDILEKAKKARARPGSGKATSTPRSTPATGGRRTSSTSA